MTDRGGPTSRLAELAPDWVLAIAISFVAVGLRYFVPIPSTAVPFAGVYPAILIATAFITTRAGAITYVLSGLLTWYFVLEPRNSFSADFAGQTSMVGYVVTGLAVLLCTISYRRAVQKAASIQIEEQQMLAGEAEHRVKNVLSLVQAIAHQSFAKADEKSMQKFVGRLKALSDAQGVLTRGRTAADLADVVRTAVAPFRAGNNFVITGPMTTIDAQQAVSLALLLHELCTNATKYGALSVPGGKVTIRWDVTDGHYELCWEESGGPIVQPPARKGFGTRLLSKSNMHATVDYAPTGVVCRIKQSRKAR